MGCFLFFVFKSFGLGRAFFLFFSVLIFLFFPQSSAANIICTNWRSEKKKKKKLKPQQPKKNQKNQNRPKTRQPNSSEVHSYLLAGNQMRSQGQKRGHSGATGTPHTQETRTRSATQPEAPHCSTQCEELTTRRDTTHFIHLYFPLFWYLLRTEHL